MSTRVLGFTKENEHESLGYSLALIRSMQCTIAMNKTSVVHGLGDDLASASSTSQF